MLCFITNKKGTESSKILNIFVHAPLLKGDDVRYYFPGLCGVSETTKCQTGSLLRPISLMFPYSRRVMIVLRRCLYCAVSDGYVFGLFVPLPPVVLTGFHQGASISLEAGLPNCLSQCCVRRVSLTVPKHLDSCSTFHKAVVTSRAFLSHFVSGSKGWVLPRPLHPMWNRGPQ